MAYLLGIDVSTTGVKALVIGQDGQVLSTGEWAGGSLRSLAVFSGAGVRHGVVLKRPVGLVDVVPTLCHATGLPLPREAEGAVIHQALDDAG